MSQKHWTFTNIIRYIEDYKKNPQLIERMKWEFISEGESIVEFVKLCKHLVLERTIDPKIHQTTAIYLRYSQQLLLKKKRAIRRLGIEKKKIACSSKCKLGILTVDLLDKNDIAISKKR